MSNDQPLNLDVGPPTFLRGAEAIAAAIIREDSTTIFRRRVSHRVPVVVVCSCSETFHPTTSVGLRKRSLLHRQHEPKWMHSKGIGAPAAAADSHHASGFPGGGQRGPHTGKIRKNQTDLPHRAIPGRAGKHAMIPDQHLGAALDSTRQGPATLLQTMPNPTHQSQINRLGIPQASRVQTTETSELQAKIERKRVKSNVGAGKLYEHPRSNISSRSDKNFDSVGYGVFCTRVLPDAQSFGRFPSCGLWSLRLERGARTVSPFSSTITPSMHAVHEVTGAGVPTGSQYPTCDVVSCSKYYTVKWLWNQKPRC